MFPEGAGGAVSSRGEIKVTPGASSCIKYYDATSVICEDIRNLDVTSYQASCSVWGVAWCILWKKIEVISHIVTFAEGGIIYHNFLEVENINFMASNVVLDFELFQ